MLCNGAVAQLGERVVRNDEVSGSIPLSSTKSLRKNRKPLRKTLAVGDPFGPHSQDRLTRLGPIILEYCQALIGQIMLIHGAEHGGRDGGAIGTR